MAAKLRDPGARTAYQWKAHDLSFQTRPLSMQLDYCINQEPHYYLGSSRSSLERSS